MTDDTTTTDPTAKPTEEDRRSLRPDERVLLLDMWQRSGLPARDFGALVGISRHTLFAWKQKFDRYGPAGLADQMRGAPRGSRLTILDEAAPDIVRRAQAMGEPETYAQLTAVSIVGGL